jgi:non-heme chloroperoxidase
MAPLLSPFTAAAQSTAHPSLQEQGTETMTFVRTDDGTQIFYKDWGPKNAQPIVFHHGWPLNSDDWDAPNS